MGQFVYYLPGKRNVTEAELSQWLPQIEPARGYCQRFTAVGPDGKGGMLVAGRQAAGEVQHDADCQTWIECENGTFWLGYKTEAKPTPDDLARDDQISGHWVDMADGSRWHVPILRVIESGTILPHMHIISLTPDGKWVSLLRPEFIELGQRVLSAWDQFRAALGFSEAEEGNVEISFEAEMDLVVDGLRLNYRVSKWEVAAMGLLNALSLRRVVEALLDLPSLKAMAQKKTADG